MNKEGKILKKIFNVIYNMFLFIILIPFNIVKYLKMLFCYPLKIIVNDKSKQQVKNNIIESNAEDNIIKPTIKYSNRDNELKSNTISELKVKENKILAQNELDIDKISKQNKDEKRPIFTINVNSDDAKRSNEKIIFKYVAKNPNGKIEKGKFIGYSKLDVHSYLLSEGYEVYEIKSQAKANLFNTDIGLNKPIKKSLLVFYLTQISTYLKSGIPIVDSLKILENQSKKQIEKTIWKLVIYEMTLGSSLSDAMLKCGNNVFPKLLINMIKTAEVTGNLPEVLDEQAKYYKSIEKSRKDMINAMMYPIFVLVFSIAIISYIMIAVIPQFVNIYNIIGTDLPKTTLIIISISNFFKKNIIKIILTILVIIAIFVILFKKNIIFKKNIQYLIMHFPIIGNIIIYNEVTMFSKTFASLLNNNIFITDSMEILSKITDNEIYKKIIYEAVTCLSKGESISTAFNNHWAFPNIAYQMIITGEKTGQLGLMMENVANYYQDEHSNAIARVNALIEPLLIIFLAIIVGGILLAVIIPMFNMYSNII